MFEFHRHKCWISTLGFRAGVIALDKLDANKIKI